MSKFVGEEKVYIISKSDDVGETLLQVDGYNGNFYWTEEEGNAFKFKDIEKANKFKTSLEEMFKEIGKESNFEVIEKHIVSKAV